jgi:signal transduction histidine kinase
MTADALKRMEGYRRLIDIARDLASTLDLDILLNRIIRAAADISDAQAASILLYDNAARQLFFQVSTDLEQPLMRGLAVPLDSIAGWIVTNRQPVRIADVSKDPRHFAGVEQAAQYSARSLMGVPLITKDKVVGALEVLNKRAGEFSATDEDLLRVLGAQAAVAIENARLFQQSDLISEFVHELRTPLASLTTATYLLLRPEMSQQQREQIVKNIHGETLRLNTLASSFLDLARLESGRVEYRKSQFELAGMLGECLEVMRSKAEEEKIIIEVDAPAGLPPMEADRDKIKQVVLNLLSNAIKYNRPGGRVSLGVRAEEHSLCLTVRDTGMGIPAEALPNLFQKFFRVRETEGKITGTGLGLSICKQIVQGHGGTISVESKAGEGTTFTVVLPRTGKVNSSAR